MYLRRSTPGFGPLVLLLLILIACALCLQGCQTAPGATNAAPTTQGVINATKASYDSLTSAITAAGTLVDQGVLKGQDARNAGKGFDQAKAGLDVALVSLRAAQAAASAAAAASAPK